MYTHFVIKRLPASVQQLRSGKPDATACQLVSTPEESLLTAYENSIPRVAGGTAAAAVELIRYLRTNGITLPFLVVAAPKKLAACRERYLRGVGGFAR